MTQLPACALYTKDDGLVRRIAGLLRTSAAVQPAKTSRDLENLLQSNLTLLLFLDLRRTDWRDTLAHVQTAWPDTVVVALGILKSEPFVEIASAGVFAVEDVEADRARLQATAASALKHLALVRQHRETEEFLDRDSRAAPAAESPAPTPSRALYRSFRNNGNLDTVLQNMVEHTAEALGIMRAGIFLRTQADPAFRCRAALRCTESCRALEVPESDPLIAWLENHVHIVSSLSLDHTPKAADRQMLKQALTSLGAEVLMPLHAENRLIGWFFAGPRATGLPYQTADLERLAVMGDHLSTALENIFLCNRLAAQNNMLETLFDTLPTGIVVASTNGRLSRINKAAETIFGQAAAKVLHQPAEALSSRLADLLGRTLRGDAVPETAEWSEPGVRRSLAVQATRLMSGARCVGAMALIHDKTREAALEEKQEALERATFWTELAASMSHEIRNPLVAIKTFAQLLPERYSDSEFRREFSKLMTHEVDRLNGIVEQINDFANPPDLMFRPVDIRKTLQSGIDTALKRFSHNGFEIKTRIDEKLPEIQRDERSLIDCFAHLIANAIEASLQQSKPSVTLTVDPLPKSDGVEGLLVSVQDNGKGIAANIRDKVFSPFCTTKARGMGLGLPGVKRTVIDHNGWVRINTGDKGTCVTVMLPANRSEVCHETSADRR